ncbi:LD-carboxypeptidase (plasmid) [Bacillus sp. ZJS3]|nr:LD-carboxypeptidase [Bacillus sp. ZJS3]
MQGIHVFEKMGLEVIIGRHVFDVKEDFASSDQKRFADLHEVFRRVDPMLSTLFLYLCC